MSSPDVMDFYLTLFFDKEPHLTAQALMDSFALEGYVCSELPANGMWVRLLRGRTGVYIANAAAVDHTLHPDYYPAVTHTDIDYDKVYLINPREAWADFQESKYEAEFQFRIAVEDGDDMRFFQNELFTALLGIHQVEPLRAIWLDHLHIFIGRMDISEYTSYRCTQGDMPPAATPDPVMFGTLVQTSPSGGIQAWTTGLDLFGHSNVYVDEDALTAIDAAGIVFNTGRYVLSNRVLSVGESLSTRGFCCQIEAGTWDDEPALRLVPGID